ncbi:hypothetical protein [Virgisporangium aliadipatigenens]|nr:hypothetical protein [Virgisporangium aliadipatigenens]
MADNNTPMPIDGACAEAVRDLIARRAEVAHSGVEVQAAEPLPWWRSLVRRLSHETPDAHHPAVPAVAGAPWQDRPSPERRGWRSRSAYLKGGEEPVAEVDYQTCMACRLGSVEQPYTLPRFQRRGLAAAALAALRAEHPGLSWHTLGGHIDGSPAFWDTVGADIPGGYRPRGVCAHVTPGG